MPTDVARSVEARTHGKLADELAGSGTLRVALKFAVVARSSVI